MLFISHRGNLNGPIPERENSPDYIQEAIDAGFMVEVDVKIIDGEAFLGHGDKSYHVDLLWLRWHAKNLLLHLKNREAVWLISNYPTTKFHYFCNEKDEFSITSHGYILCWSKHPNRCGWGKHCMLPLITAEDISEYSDCALDSGAIISDHIDFCKEKFG